MIEVSKSELARRLDVSKGRVSQLVRQGMPVLPSGLVDFDACCRWIDQHVDRGHSGWGTTRKPPAASPPAASPPRQSVAPLPGPASAIGADPAKVLLVAKAKRALADAKRAERLERKQAGELFERTEVNTYITNFSTLARDHVLTQAERLAALLVPMTDEKQIYDLIRRDGMVLLQKLSKAIEASGVAEKAVAQ
ncbi:MAG: hypothetical protein ACLQVN_05010 [Bryobacteraceae bacterium]